MERKPLMCAQCRTTPFAYLTGGGVLVITSRHHGEKHVNTLTIDELKKMISDYETELEANSTISAQVS